VTMELAFSLASFALTLYTLRMLSRSLEQSRGLLEQNARLYRHNTDLRSAVEYLGGVIAGFEEDEDGFDIECDCERCQRKALYLVN